MVVICWMPEANPRCADPNNSLLLPIFAGLKNAAWVARAKNPSIATGMLRMTTAPQMAARMITCATAAPNITSRFEKRSLIQPASGANNT